MRTSRHPPRLQVASIIALLSLALVWVPGPALAKKKGKPIEVVSNHNEFDQKRTHEVEDWITIVSKDAKVKIRPLAVDNYGQGKALYGLRTGAHFSKCLDIDVIKWQISGTVYESQVGGYDSDYSSSGCTTAQHAQLDEDLWFALAHAQQAKVRLETDEGYLESYVDMANLDRLRRSIDAIDAAMPERVTTQEAQQSEEHGPSSSDALSLRCEQGHEYPLDSTFGFCPEDGLPLQRPTSLRCENGHTFSVDSGFKFCPEDGHPLVQGDEQASSGASDN